MRPFVERLLGNPLIHAFTWGYPSPPGPIAPLLIVPDALKGRGGVSVSRSVSPSPLEGAGGRGVPGVSTLS
jgi:hypothetical protein